MVVTTRNVDISMIFEYYWTSDIQECLKAKQIQDARVRSIIWLKVPSRRTIFDFIFRSGVSCVKKRLLSCRLFLFFY
jgi:hypothetical protein